MAAVDGKDDDGNIWPGYVDALTTMTMVMTLIMMIMAIVVFGLSQEISRRYLAKIAFAAEIDASPSRPTALIADEIIDRLKRQTDAFVTRARSPGDDQAQDGEATAKVSTHGPAPEDGRPGYAAQEGRDGASMLAQAEIGAGVGGREKGRAMASSDGGGTAPGHSPVDGSAILPGGPGSGLGAGEILHDKGELTASLRTQRRHQSGETLAPDPVDAPVTPPAPLLIESSREADLAKPEKGGAIATGHAMITVKFRDRATQLDDDSVVRLKTATGPDSPFRLARQVEIAGNADPASGAVSDARRTAYYRILGLRKELVAAGFETARLTLRIEESAMPEMRNSVRLTAIP